MNVSLLPAGHPAWTQQVDLLGGLLGAPDNPTLFPYHYLSVALQRIGGLIAWIEEDEQPQAVGFLFPRARPNGSASSHGYTLRYHGIDPAFEVDLNAIALMVSNALGGSVVIPYDPSAPHRFAPSHTAYGDIDIGRPDPVEAERIRALQQSIWSAAPEFLYPADIHSIDFGLATSLIARVEGNPAGFLYGTYKVDGPALPVDWQQRYHGHLRIESQTMGVLPDYRGRRIGYLLKRVQGQQAWDEGIGVVHWTVDPLQFPNAVLNFGLLRGMAFNFYPNLYPIRNELNQVHASRFAITWLPGSDRVRQLPLYEMVAPLHDLAQHPEIERVNRGWTDVNYTLRAALIAIEVPANWTALQSTSIAEAQRWREVSDQIFSTYVGRQPGKYVITGVGRDGEQRYLIGEQVNEALWSALG